MFFDKSWKDVSESEIKELSKKLSSEMGGWVFHQKVNFRNPTPHIKISQRQPEVMLDE